jgi:hypothetical protein
LTKRKRSLNFFIFHKNRSKKICNTPISNKNRLKNRKSRLIFCGKNITKIKFYDDFVNSAQVGVVNFDEKPLLLIHRHRGPPPSRGLLPPLPRSPSLEREAWVTLRRKHLIRHLTVTPSPTGEGNRKALFRQQIFYETIDGKKG